MSNNFSKSPSLEQREADRAEKHRERERDNSNKIDLLEQKVTYFSNSLSAQLENLQTSLDKIDKKIDTIEEDVKIVMVTRIPTIEQQLIELKTRASAWSGIVGLIAGGIVSVVVSIFLHFVGAGS